MQWFAQHMVEGDSCWFDPQWRCLQPWARRRILGGTNSHSFRGSREGGTHSCTLVSKCLTWFERVLFLNLAAKHKASG